jgi:hypothetical protein
MLIAFAGPRLGELAKMRWEDHVDMANGQIRVPRGKTVSRVVAIAPAPPTGVLPRGSLRGDSFFQDTDALHTPVDAIVAWLSARADVVRAMPGGERAVVLIEQVVALEAREERVALGDTLPAGLRMVLDDDAAPDENDA